MERRTFLQLSGAALLNLGNSERELPKYRVVSRFEGAANPGMPGPFAGKVVRVRSPRCVDEAKDQVDQAVVREMMARGMCGLTGESKVKDAWLRFFSPNDIVGIKVNCVGRPNVVSSPEIIVEIIRNLRDLGLKPEQIVLFDRFVSQLNEVDYAKHVPQSVRIHGAEEIRGGLRHYDPATYVEADFFGEEDNRSYMIAMISQFTKIINIPNMKDHGASGVTGCLKNIAYGSFSNVDRSHRYRQTHTHSFIGTLASVEPVRSRTVLQILDGLRGVWQGGPFVADPRFVFYPKEITFGTDPVALDRLLLDIIEAKRKAEGAISLWDRSVPAGSNRKDPNVSVYIREPGHIEYASKLGLGVYDPNKIKTVEIEA